MREGQRKRLRAGRNPLAVHGCDLLFLFLFEIPGHGFLKAFLELCLGLIAEFFGCAADVGERVLDVTFSGRAVVGLFGEADVFCDCRVDLVESDALASAYVEDSSCCDFTRCGCCKQVGANCIVDVIEISAG